MPKETQNFNGQFEATQVIKQTVQTKRTLADIWNEYFSAQIHYTIGTGHQYPDGVIPRVVKTCADIADLQLAEYKARHGE